MKLSRRRERIRRLMLKRSYKLRGRASAGRVFRLEFSGRPEVGFDPAHSPLRHWLPHKFKDALAYRFEACPLSSNDPLSQPQNQIDRHTDQCNLRVSPDKPQVRYSQDLRHKRFFARSCTRAFLVQHGSILGDHNLPPSLLHPQTEIAIVAVHEEAFIEQTDLF